MRKNAGQKINANKNKAGSIAASAIDDDTFFLAANMATAKKHRAPIAEYMIE